MKKIVSLILVAFCLTSFVFAQGGTESNPAETYPERTISIYIPARTGGDCDQVTRIIAPALSDELGTAVVAENIAGGSGNLALAKLLENEADGYQFILFNGAIFTGEVANAFKCNVDDFVPVCTVAKNDTQILVAAANGPYNTPEKLVDAIKNNPGTVKFAATMGAPSQLHAIALEQAAGGKFKKVDVASGSDKLVALLSGEVNVVSSTHSLVKDYVTKGEIVPLGSICAERTKYSEDTPTFKELGYDLGPDFAATYILLAKKGTPDYVMNRISDAVAKIMQDPELVSILENLYYTPYVTDGEEVQAWFQNERSSFLEMKDAVANDRW